MKMACVAAGVLLASASTQALAQAKDWPSYNKALDSNRYANVSDIDPKNIANLKVVCSYDTGEQGAFQSGLLMVDGSLYGTTEHDTFSLDPNSCKLNWRSHEDFAAGKLKVNRGVAWLEKRVFRGTTDGQVLAYDARTGKKLWATAIADAKKGESVPAAPIAWNGMVFIGTAGGDAGAVRGRMYALDATSGKVTWEFFMTGKAPGDVPRGPEAPNPQASPAKAVSGAATGGGASWSSYSLDPKTGLLYVPGADPTTAPVAAGSGNSNEMVVLDAKTGAFQKRLRLSKHDSHHWDASSAPVLFPNRRGLRVLAATPKDGNLYLLDLADGHQIYKKPVTQQLGGEAPITTKGTRFCPGTLGGADFNGPAFDPAENLLLTGEVHWCSTVKAAPPGKTGAAGEQVVTMDDVKQWAGVVTASDADTGVRKWQFKTPAPVISGVTATSGRLVVFGDMAGTFYALDALDGTKLLAKDLGGPIGGGVIAYDTNMGEKFAVAVGMVAPAWPTAKVNGKVVVLGL